MSLRSKYDAASDEFNLAEAFSEFLIEPHETCYVAFTFELIYGFATRELVRYFDDIWYPGPDDINIFDESLPWMIAIDHDGSIRGGRYSS